VASLNLALPDKERERDGEADIADAARISDTKRNFKPMLNGRQDR